MSKQKTIPELKAEIAANERQLAQLRHKQQQLENRAAYYEKGDRRKRAHRLITHGAAIESVAPLAKVLSETEFYVVTGSYEGTENFVRKLERITSRKFAEKMEDSE